MRRVLLLHVRSRHRDSQRLHPLQQQTGDPGVEEARYVNAFDALQNLCVCHGIKSMEKTERPIILKLIFAEVMHRKCTLAELSVPIDRTSIFPRQKDFLVFILGIWFLHTYRRSRASLASWICKNCS